MEEFMAYLQEQIGQPYLWGGQHTRLTPQNYVEVITRKETSPENIEAVILYCEKKFAEGATELYAYDCSGLGMYYLQNLTHIYPKDMTADGMMQHCAIVETPKKGDWVFRLNDGRATHIGYMVSDTEVVHAAGRSKGVVRVKYDKAFWHRAGRPDCFREIAYEIKVKGSVRVREGNGVRFRKICTVKNCRLPYCGQAVESPNWYLTMVDGKNGYITSNPRYTEIVEVVY